MADQEEGAACTLAIRMATGDALTDEQIKEGVLDPMDEKLRRTQSSDPSLSKAAAIDKAAAELARQQVAAAIREATQRIHRERASAYQDGELDAMTSAGMRSDKAARSFLQGTAGELYGSENSVDAYGLSKGAELKMPVLEAVSKYPGMLDMVSSFWTMRGNPEFMAGVKDEVARLNGNTSIEPTQDEAVIHLAQAIKAALDSAREGMNKVGAMIGRLDGYTGKLNHDPIKVEGGFWRELAALKRAASEPDSSLGKLSWGELVKRAERTGATTWVKFILPLLHPKTFEGTDWSDLTAYELPTSRFKAAPEFTEEDDAALTAKARQQAQELHALGIISDPTDMRELFLYRVWQRIVAGRNISFGGALDNADFVPRSRNLADAVGKSKTLEFLSPRHETTYSEKFTRGSYYANIMQQLDRAGRNIALLERLGPNPEEGYEHIIQRLAATSQARGETLAVGKLLYSSATRAPFDIVSGVGNIPVSLRLAEISQNVRGWMATTKLGSIPLSKAADYTFASQAMMRYGANYLQGQAHIWKAIADLPSEERALAAKALGAGMRNFTGRLVAGTVAGDGRPGLMARWTTQTYRASGFTGLNQLVERVMINALQGLYGEVAGRGWADLPADIRDTFGRFGIGEEHWDAVREGQQASEDGQTYLTLDHLDHSDDAKTEEARGLFHMLFHNAMADAINEPRAREQVEARAPGSAFGLSGPVLRPGSLEGEVSNALFQFKGFLTSAVGRHLGPALQNIPTRPMMLVNVILGSMVAGYVSMAAKALSRGEMPRTPQDLIDSQGDSAPVAWGKVVLSALAQGGGLGIYGDFLFGEMDRNGQDFDLAATQGPVMSQGEQVGKILLQLVHGGEVNGMDGRSQIPGELAKLTASNIPVINTWYTRTALDYLLFWRLQEAASPGFLQRSQDRMQEKAATHYWLPPTTTSPYASIGVQ